MVTLKISPGAGAVGTKVKVKGTGFTKGHKYTVRVGETQTCEFRATPRGDIPSGLSFTVPDLAASGERGELGTAIEVRVEPAGRAERLAAASFELRASLTLDARSAGTGYKVRAAGRGLLPGEHYYLTSVVGEDPDVAVGLMTAGPGGSAESEFIVPATLDPKEYHVQIKNRRGHYLALRDPPRLALLGYSDSSLVPGRPEGPESRPYCPVLVTLPFTSELAVPIVATVYAVISRAGRARRITSTAVNLAARGSGEALICFSTLEPGSYKVDAFAATMTGSIISGTVSFPLKVEKT